MTGARATAAAVAAALLLAGCGSSTGSGNAISVSPTAGPTTQSTDQPTDQPTTGVTVEGTDGTVAINGSDELPADWPADVALPDGGTIVSSVSADQGGQQGWNVVLTYPDAPADVADAFDGALTGAGFAQDTKVTSGDTTLLAYSSDTYSVAVTVTPNDGGGTGAGVTVSTK